MSQLWTKDGTLITKDGVLCYCEECPCGCPYHVEVTINWGDYADLDLYGKVAGGSAVYYENRSGGGLSLNVDAHPNCSSSPSPPETIIGQFQNSETFYFWYDQFSDCTAETSPSLKRIRVTNESADQNIRVNNTLVAPGNVWDSSSLAYQPVEIVLEVNLKQEYDVAIA